MQKLNPPRRTWGFLSWSAPVERKDDDQVKITSLSNLSHLLFLVFHRSFCQISRRRITKPTSRETSSESDD